jgi:hypothetical protein
MKEVDRLEFKEELEAFHSGSRRMENAFCVTQDSIIWTMEYGTFLGVSREKGADGKRRIWVEEVPGALMPKAGPPIVNGLYLYYTNMGEPLELLCYESAKARD